LENKSNLYTFVLPRAIKPGIKHISMKSRISIKADFVANTPYILIEDNPSEDTRDELIDEFFKKLGYTSSWCRVDFLYTDALVAMAVGLELPPLPQKKW